MVASRLILQEANGTLLVLFQPAGLALPESAGGPEPFEFPLTVEEREDLRWYLEDYLLAPYAVYEEHGAAIESRLGEWGRRLFAAVFGIGKPGRDAYQRAALSLASTELWISSRSPQFLALPWELLEDPDRTTQLALDLVGINRTLPTTAAPAQRLPGSRLRVLMVIARPGGRRDVRYRMIARPLLARLGPVAGDVQLEVLRPPTYDALRSRLAAARQEGEPFQIVHFDGHGSFGLDESRAADGPERHRYGQQEQGYLAFETKVGDLDLVAAGDLAPQLARNDVPLLVFNACRSGMVKGEAGPEAAVATRLLTSGAGAVVAMSYTVYAVAAAEFMAAFYEALFAGRTVTQAVTEGRRQMKRADDRPSPKGPLPLADWIVPVCYMRSEVSFPELEHAQRRRPLAEDLAALRSQATEVAREAERDPLAPEGGHFFGRDGELQELERSLRTRKVVLLHGVGGTGKTELAKGFARWLQETGGLDDPGLVFFHSFERGLPTFGLPGVLGAIGLRLFGPEFVTLNAEQKRDAVLQVIEKHRVLLVWDNFETTRSMPDSTGATPPLDAAERAEVQEFLAEVIRRGSQGGVLVTSRSEEHWLGGQEIQRLEVEGLDTGDTLEYAETLLAGREKARLRRGDRAYGRLLEVLAGHPLSLRLILPMLEQVSDAQELVEALEGRRDLPQGFEGGQGRLHSLGACVHYSFQHLGEEHRQRLPALALFEGVVDVDVLATLSQVGAAPARLRGIGKDTWEASLEACGELGLLTNLGAGMYRIHPALPRYLTALWREVAGADFEAERSAAGLANIEAHATFGAWLFRQLRAGNAQLAMALIHEQRRSLGAAAAEALGRGYIASAQAILEALDEYWDARGLVEEATAWVDRCRAALESADGNAPDLDSPAGALWLFMVGSQANRVVRSGDLGEAEARYDSIRRVLEASGSPSTQGPLGVIYHQLGMVAQERGDLATAESFYRKSLNVKEALENRSGMSPSYHQLGMVAQLRGDLETAESWYRKSLEIEEELANRPGMASSYGQLGIVAQVRGDLETAESWYRKSLEIFEALGDRRHMATSYHQLGMVAQYREDLAAAEWWYHKSLEIFEALADRPHLAINYHQLGRVAQLREDLATAESWYRRSLEIFKALGDRPHMETSYHQLGVVAQLRQNLVAAESWYRKSLEIAEALGNRASMAISYGQLGLLAEARERPAEALDWLVRCVGLFAEFPHPATGLAPQHLKRFTSALGVPALEESWLRCIGDRLPEAVRAYVGSA